MKDNKLVVYKAKYTKYLSYTGEINIEVKNVMMHVFQSPSPNIK